MVDYKFIYAIYYINVMQLSKFVRQSTGSQAEVIEKSSISNKAAVGSQAVVTKIKAAVKHLFGSHQAVVQKLLSSLLAVYRQSSKSNEAVIR